MQAHHPIAAVAVATLLFFAPASVPAADGHDHGDAPPAAGGPALPRFAAVSEAFELVGVLSGKQLTLYLDRTGDNAPVPDAQIELDIAGAKFRAEKHGDAVYEVVLKEAPKEGVLPITATITAGDETDLLAGELDIHESVHADEVAPARSWKAWAVWAAGGVAAGVLLALIVAAARRIAASRRPNAMRAGGAA